MKGMDEKFLGDSINKVLNSGRISSSFDAKILKVVETKSGLRKKGMEVTDSISDPISNPTSTGTIVKDSMGEPSVNSYGMEKVCTENDDVLAVKKIKMKKRTLKKLVGIGGPSCPTLAWLNKNKKLKK